MYAIYDEQTGTRLSQQNYPTIEAAQAHMGQMLAQVREQVQATGDSVAAMVLEWEIREEVTGTGVAWHHGRPPATALYE